jgi:hypothetical protein
MIKLYILYLVFGFYMLFNSLFIWMFSFYGVTVITYLSLICSAILSALISGLSLYHNKTASIAGLICLVGITPFGIHWLIYNFTDGGPITVGTEHQIMLPATVWYLVALVYSIINIYNYKKLHIITPIKKPVKLVMLFIPIVLLLWLIGLIVF